MSADERGVTAAAVVIRRCFVSLFFFWGGGQYFAYLIQAPLPAPFVGVLFGCLCGFVLVTVGKAISR